MADAPNSNGHWRVWQTADNLAKEGLLSPLHENPHCQKLTQQVVSILRFWGHEWAHINGMQSFLNKSSLQHEVEESIVTMTLLLDWMEEKAHHPFKEQQQPGVTVVDVCCGKGVFSMLLSYVFKDDGRVAKIIMLDKAIIDWQHVTLANSASKVDKRPPIDPWEECNLHDHDVILDRLESLQSPLALVGIHLCKNLSPTCIGLANRLGSHKCPFLCLAPCCLPRLAVCRNRKQSYTGIINVPIHESPDDRQTRRTTMDRREYAQARHATAMCCICQNSKDHRQRDCVMLPKDETKRIIMLQEIASKTPCWRCGVVGHFKAECPSTQSRPSLISPPAMELNVSGVLQADQPFEYYCQLLKDTLQRDTVKLVDTDLTNDSAKHQKGNWNSGRKAIYIVATS